MATTKKAASKAVTAKKDNVPAALLDELTKAGEARDAMGKDDMAIPFLQILQGLSPQCTKGEAEYIKGAEPSMLFNTVTQEVVPTWDDDDNPIPGVKAISVAYKASYIEWVPRAAGGGFVHEWDVVAGSTAITQRNDAGGDIIQPGSPIGTPGNQLAYTHTHFVFVLDPDGGYDPAIITCASTQVVPSKRWNALIDRFKLPNGATAPRFYGVWDLGTTRRQNDQGTWYVWNATGAGSILDLGPDLAATIMRDAQQFAAGVSEGEVNADHAKAAAAENPNVPSGDAGEGDDLSEEIPF